MADSWKKVANFGFGSHGTWKAPGFQEMGVLWTPAFLREIQVMELMRKFRMPDVKVAGCISRIDSAFHFLDFCACKIKTSWSFSMMRLPCLRRGRGDISVNVVKQKRTKHQISQGFLRGEDMKLYSQRCSKVFVFWQFYCLVETRQDSPILQ